MGSRTTPSVEEIKQSAEPTREKVRLLKEVHDLSLKEMAETLEMAKSSLHFHFKNLGLEPKPSLVGEESGRGRVVKSTGEKIGSKAWYQRRCQELNAEIKQIKQERLDEVLPLSPQLRAFEKGYVAEQLVFYKLLRQGFECFKPVVTTQAVDLLVKGRESGKIYRCEVKATAAKNRSLSLGQTVYNKDTGKISKAPYSEDLGIDIFILVNLLTEEVYVLPFEQAKGRKEYTLSSRGDSVQWINRYDLLK